eukprot:10550154-Alexandrium_andersonii.AAC.1
MCIRDRLRAHRRGAQRHAARDPHQVPRQGPGGAPRQGRRPQALPAAEQGLQRAHGRGQAQALRRHGPHGDVRGGGVRA